MSGIAAVLHLDGSAVPQSEVERMANVLKPYGPDRQKILVRGNAAFVFCLHQLTPEDLLSASRFSSPIDLSCYLMAASITGPSWARLWA